MKKVLQAFLSLLFLPQIKGVLSTPRHETGRGASSYTSAGGSGEGEDNFSPAGLPTVEPPAGMEEAPVRSYITLASSAFLGEESEPSSQRLFHLSLVLLSSADAIAETILERNREITLGQDAAVPLTPLEFRSENLMVRGSATFIPRRNPPAFLLSNVTVSVRGSEVLSGVDILVPATAENPLTAIILSLSKGKEKIAAALLLLIALISGSLEADGVMRLNFSPQREQR